MSRKNRSFLEIKFSPAGEALYDPGEFENSGVSCVSNSGQKTIYDPVRIRV